MSKVTIPGVNSETGFWEEMDLSNTMTRREKDDTYVGFFNRYTERIKKIESDLSAKEKDEIKSSNRNIEVLAVFVTLFTFISIETQILRSGISFITAIGFSLLMLGGLLFFLFSLNFFIKDKKVWSDFWQYIILLFVSTAVLVAGLSFIYKGEKLFYTNLDDKYYKKLEIDQNFASTTTTIQIENSIKVLKKCLSDGKWNYCLK